MSGNEKHPEEEGGMSGKKEPHAPDVEIVMPEGEKPEADFEEEAEFPEARKKRPRIRRRNPVIMLVVILFAGYMMWEFKDDLFYFFQSRTPLALGAAEEISKDRVFKSHSFVHLQGVPDFYHQIRATMRRSPRKYFRLVGTKRFFVQIDDQASKRTKSWEREFVKKKMRSRKRNLTYFNQSGRLMRWRDLTSAYDKLIAFFETKFRVPIPVTVGTFLREAIMDEPGKVWHHLVRTPESYLLLSGEAPGDNWYFLLIFIALLGFVAFNIYSLVRYFQSRK